MRASLQLGLPDMRKSSQHHPTKWPQKSQIPPPKKKNKDPLPGNIARIRTPAACRGRLAAAACPARLARASARPCAGTDSGFGFKVGSLYQANTNSSPPQKNKGNKRAPATKHTLPTRARLFLETLLLVFVGLQLRLVSAWLKE